jgi:hypothetical protein
MEICKTVRPKFEKTEDGRYVACHLYSEEYKKDNASLGVE